MKTAPSLRYLLLSRLLPAMLLMVVAGAGTAYWVAERSANLAYDRSLLNTAFAIAEQVRIVDGYPSLQLTPQARSILLTDKYDSIVFAVRGPDGLLVEGYELPLPPDALGELFEGGRHFYDSRWDGRRVRIAALSTEQEGIPLTVLTAETLEKRNAIVRDILLGMLLPELLLVIGAFVLIGVGIRSGLSPLTSLRRQLAGRSQADLSPIVAPVPEEMQPLVVEINSLLQRLAKSLASQRHFVSDAAHQLRTPIAALQAQVEVARRHSGGEQKENLGNILRAARRLSHLVDQLLALARAEPSQASPMPVVAIEPIVREAAETWLPVAIGKNIDLGFDLLPANVRGNELLLRELLSNLLDNALRHTPTGGTVTVSCGSGNGTAWLAVEDSGPGIPPEEWERVFERFYQPPGSREDGCGLGLAIVQAIAVQHSGRAVIASASTLGGARLEVRLPAVSCDETG